MRNYKGVSLPEDLVERVKQLIKKLGTYRTVAEFVKEAVRFRIEALENQQKTDEHVTEIKRWKRLVNLVENWEALEDYAGDKQGFYQLLSDAEAVEIRVAIGRLGFKKEFDNKAVPLLNRILSFCKSREFIKISENVRDEFFFK